MGREFGGVEIDQKIVPNMGYFPFDQAFLSEADPWHWVMLEG